MGCGAVWVLAYSAPLLASASQWIELSWNAADACSSSEDVLRSIDSQLGQQFVSQARLQARGQLHRQPSGEYELELQYSTDTGASDQRRIRGESCQAVSTAAALVLALALDPVRVQSEQPSRAPPPSAAAELGETTAFLVGVRVLYDTAVMALQTLGGGLRVGFRYGPLEMSAATQVFLPGEHTTSRTRLQLSYWSVDVGACYLARVAAWAIGPCASFELGQLSGTVRSEPDTSNHGSVRVHVVTLAAAGRMPIFDALHLELTAGLEWVARRPSFGAPDAVVDRPTGFGARIVAGPYLTF